jgi:hypothetical protein
MGSAPPAGKGNPCRLRTRHLLQSLETGKIEDKVPGLKSISLPLSLRCTEQSDQTYTPHG